ncbi:MAG: hypothetical protein NC115_06450 [Bacteroidales bacterium]|nr:hypothetical protein [Bacteroidales bacterium]
MKKFITLTLIAVATLLLAGCKKEKKEFSLVGKTFAAYGGRSTSFLGGVPYDTYEVWRFISDTEIETSTKKNSPQGSLIGDPVMGTYVLNYPQIIVKINNKYEDTYYCEFIDYKTFRAIDETTFVTITLEFHQQ